MGWISAEQQTRDHNGLRNVCAACGHAGTVDNPLGLSDCGSRIHRSHFNDASCGFYRREQ